MSMITATSWVPRGYAAEYPSKYAVDDRELARISALAKLKLEDAQEDLVGAQKQEDAAPEQDGEDARMEEDGDAQDQSTDADAEEGGVSIARTNGDADDDLREYDLENYDSDDGAQVKTLTTIGNMRDLAYHENDADDAYLTARDADEEEERDELRVLASDNMVLAARVEDEVAHMEVYVYEDEADNLYVHHDIMLPAIPLCLEWLDLPVGKSRAGGSADTNSKANYVAIGTFEPDIEIWDLDTVDCMYPNAILGQGGEESKPAAGKKKKKKSKKANDRYHVDAVLALAANKNHRTLLASASADKTVKLWDLNTTTCAKSYSHHTDKVCSIEWSPKETAVLLSGSYDKAVVAADMRAPDAKVPRWGVESDIESVRWDSHNPNYFFATTEAGFIHYFDTRVTPSSTTSSKPIWQLQAHDASVSSFDINPTVPGFLATGSTDKEVKLWSVQANGPSMVVSRNLGVGKVFSTTFGPDPEVAFRLAVAGSKGSLQIWDTSTNSAVRRAFASRMKGDESQTTERLIGVRNEDDSSGDDSEEEQKDGWESMEED